MQPQVPGHELPAAHCALHAGQPFTAICPRCGTYMCNTCSDNGRFELCAACRERTGTGSFPLRRDSWTFDALLRHSYDAYRSNLTTVTLATLITFAVLIAFNVVGRLITLAFPDQLYLGVVISLLMFIPQMVAQGALTLGMIAITLSAARGEKPNVEMLFSQFGRIGSWFVQSLVIYLVLFAILLVVAAPVGVMVFLGSDGALIAGLAFGLPASIAIAYVFLGLMFGNIELVHDPKLGALEALKASWQAASGQRWALLGCWCLLALAILGGLAACVIGVVFTAGFCGVMFSALFLTLKNGHTQNG